MHALTRPRTADGRRSLRAATLAACGLAILLVATYPAYTAIADDNDHAVASLDALAWIQGTWRGEHEGSNVEEVWSAPAAGSMMGMFRWVTDDQVRLYEILTITAEDDGVTMRIRHFNAKLNAWEDKDKPLAFRLIETTEGKAVFEDPQREHPRRIIYRKADDDTLLIRLEGTKDGQPAVDEFKLKRHGA